MNLTTHWQLPRYFKILWVVQITKEVPSMLILTILPLHQHPGLKSTIDQKNQSPLPPGVFGVLLSRIYVFLTGNLTTVLSRSFDLKKIGKL